MSEAIEIAGIKVPKADWEATPPSIQALVRVLEERLAQQNKRLAEQSEQLAGLNERLSDLEERLNQTSKNSSKPRLRGWKGVSCPRCHLPISDVA